MTFQIELMSFFVSFFFYFSPILGPQRGVYVYFIFFPLYLSSTYGFCGSEFKLYLWGIVIKENVTKYQAD